MLARERRGVASEARISFDNLNQVISGLEQQIAICCRT
jgi:hypothetical protein